MKTAIKACKKVKGKKDTFCTGGIGGSSYFEFELGKIYELPNPENLKLCAYGFHYFRKEDLCFGINFFEKETVFVEIEILGNEISDTYKRCTNKIKILNYIPKKIWKKSIKKNDNSGKNNSGYYNSGNSNSGKNNSGYYNSGNSNSGDNNSGNQNSGNWNSGYDNSGNWNSGHDNSGNSNSGHYNSGNFNSGNNNSGDNNSGHDNSGNWNSGNDNSGNDNSGHYNSGNWNSGNWNSGNNNSGNNNSGNWNSCNRETGFFNIKDPKIINVFGKSCLRKNWEKVEKPKFLYFTIRKEETYKEAFQKSWDNAIKEDRLLIESLPNFDWKIFTEISGIKKERE